MFCNCLIFVIVNKRESGEMDIYKINTPSFLLVAETQRERLLLKHRW